MRVFVAGHSREDAMENSPAMPSYDTAARYAGILPTLDHKPAAEVPLKVFYFDIASILIERLIPATPTD